MRGSRNLCRGRAGLTARKQPGQRFFFCFVFCPTYFTVYRGGQIVLLHYNRENYTFPRIRRGSNFSQGGPTFPRGGGGPVQMLISIETNITYDFPGGWSGPPLWIRTLDRQVVKGAGSDRDKGYFCKGRHISPISYMSTH